MRKIRLTKNIFLILTLILAVTLNFASFGHAAPKNKKKKPAMEVTLLNVQGDFMEMYSDTSTITLITPDGVLVDVVFNKKTKFLRGKKATKPSSFQYGNFISIDYAIRDDKKIAVNVRLGKNPGKKK